MMCTIGIPSGELTSPLLAAGTFESILFQTSPYSKIWVILFRVTGTETPFIIIFWSPTPRKGLPAYQKIRNRHPKPSTYWGFTPVKACTGRPNLKELRTVFRVWIWWSFDEKNGSSCLLGWENETFVGVQNGLLRFLLILYASTKLKTIIFWDHLKVFQSLGRETQFWALQAPTPSFLNIRQRYSTRSL